MLGQGVFMTFMEVGPISPMCTQWSYRLILLLKGQKLVCRGNFCDEISASFLISEESKLLCIYPKLTLKTFDCSTPQALRER